MQAKIIYTNNDNTTYDNVINVQKIFDTGFNKEFIIIYSADFGMVEILASTVKEITLK